MDAWLYNKFANVAGNVARTKKHNTTWQCMDAPRGSVCVYACGSAHVQVHVC